MRIEKTKKPFIRKTTALFIGFILFLLAISLIAYTYWQRHRTTHVTPPSQSAPAPSDNSIKYAPPSADEKQSNNKQKDEITKNSPTPPPAPPSSTHTISATLVRSGQSGAGAPVSIRVTINGASSGECAVTLTKDGQPTVTKRFQVVSDVSTARCDAADIPASDFAVSGTWKMELVVTSGTNTSNLISQPIEVTK